MTYFLPAVLSDAVLIINHVTHPDPPFLTAHRPSSYDVQTNLAFFFFSSFTAIDAKSAMKFDYFLPNYPFIPSACLLDPYFIIYDTSQPTITSLLHFKLNQSVTT